MAFNGGFTTQGVPYITGSDGQILTWSDAEQAWIAADAVDTGLTTVSTTNGIVGDGTSGNPVQLDTSISVQNLTVTNTASIAHIDTLEMQSLIVGDKYITILSGANNHATADGAGFLWGSGSVDATTGDQGSIAYALYRSGSDALELFPNVFISGTLDVAGGISTRSLPAMTASHVLYVSTDGSDANIGSFNRPFATLQKANDYALATYTNQSEAVLVKILPGSYSGFNVTRRNIYFVTEYNNSIERAVTINSPVKITASGTGKYSDIYGFDGILFTAGAVSEPLLHIQGSGSSGIYVQNCQLYTNSNNVNANVIRVDGTWSQEKVLLRNSIIQANQSGPDLLKILGGDIEIDSCRFYLNTTTNTSASAISASGDTSLIIDRALIENYSSTPAVKFASARTFAISNSSITKGGTGRAFEVSSSAAIIGNCFIGANVTVPANLPNIGTNISVSGSNIYYANLTSLVPTVPVTLIGAIPLTEVHGTVLAASVTSSLGFSGRLYGTASYALDAGTIGGVSASLYARKDQNNIFTGENEFRDDISVIYGKNLSLVLDPLSGVSGDLTVQGGLITNIGGDIQAVAGGNIIVDAGGEFQGSGTGLTDISSSNWRDGGSGPEQQFIDDVRSLFSGSNRIIYDKTTGVIDTTINPNLYITIAEAYDKFAQTGSTNTFTEPQIIEVDTGGGSLLTVNNTNVTNAQFIVDFSGSVGVRSYPHYDRTNHDLDPFALTVNDTIIQKNTTKGIIQEGGYGPVILRTAGGYRDTFDQGGDNTYETFGKYGIWVLPNELTFTIPDTNVRTYSDPPQQNWFKFRVASRSGPSVDIFSISNFGTAVLDADTTINGNLDLSGDMSANSFTGSFSGSAEGIYGLTGSMWTGVSSFADDVRAQLNAGSGINYDPVSGTIIWTGIGGTGGLISKNNITGSGKFGEEFDLVDDITVDTVTANSVTAYLSGTADYANDSALLDGYDSSDFAKIHDPTVIFSGDLVAENITANISLNGPGTGITDINSSNWTGGTPGFESDVRNQISGSYPISYDPVTGEITYLGTVSTIYVQPNLVGDGTIGLPLDLASDITVNSVTGDLIGNADTATAAITANYATDSGQLIGVAGNLYARRDTSNTFSQQNTFTAQRNTFKDIGALDVTASHFVGDGVHLTNLTASNISNWYNDVSNVFKPGIGIIFTKVGNYTYITASGGGGGGGLTTGSIEGSGIIGDEIRLKPGIFVDYIDYNTITTPYTNVLGRTQYDSQSEMLQYNLGSNYGVNLGQQLVCKVQNTSGAQINKGMFVSVNGNASTGVPTVEASDSTNITLAKKCIGIALDDILDGAEGYVLTNGIIYGVDTSAYTAGSILYLDVSGEFTDIKPVPSEETVVVGVVVESSLTGSILTKISNAGSIEELRDVSISPTKNDGDLIVWDDASTSWKNSHDLVGDYTLNGTLSASSGITSSAGFLSDSTVISDIKVKYAETASYWIDPGAVRTFTNNTFTQTNTFQSNTIFSGSVTLASGAPFKFNGPLTASEARFTGNETVFTNDIRVLGTASIAYLETINQTSLNVGDKYITILSGAGDHTSLDGSGLLWGSGSTDATTGPNTEAAYVRYVEITDQLEIFPGLRVSGSLTSSNGLIVTGSLQCTTDISASAISASYIYGNGSTLSNVNASTATNNIITVTTSSTYGTINVGSSVSFSGSLFCAADNTDDRRSNFVGVVLQKSGNTYTVATTGMVSASAATSFVGGDVAYVDGAGMITTFSNIPSGQNVTQVGIASYDVGTSGNIILQPRIFGVKA